MIAELQQKAQQLLTENASIILTAGGVVGTVGTAVLTGRAAFKAAEVIAIAETELELMKDAPAINVEIKFSKKEKVLAVWPLFIPPVVLGGATITSIVMANRISAKRAAALAAAYGLAEGRLEEYKAKTLEKLGVNKEQKLRDEIAQDRVNENPPNKEVIILASGDVLCYDMLTGRYFQSTVENIRKAENQLNTALFHHQYASLSEFYENIGLAPTGFTDEVGWNQLKDGNLEVKFSSVMSPDEKPCLAIDFNNAPHPEYTQLY